MKKYKVEVIKSSFFSEIIKEKDIDTYLADYLEHYLNNKHDRGWNFLCFDSLTIEVKTSLLSKRKKLMKNVAVFTKAEKKDVEKTSEEIAGMNISLGPAIKKM